MSKTRLECRQVILKNWTQMTPGSETLSYIEGLRTKPIVGRPGRYQVQQNLSRGKYLKTRC